MDKVFIARLGGGFRSLEMVGGVELLLDVPRLEEKLIIKALRGAGFELRITNVKYEPLTWDRPAEISLVRTISMLRAAYSASVREASGARAINCSKAILISGDKILTLSALKSSGIDFPESVVALNGEAAERAGELLGYPLIDKPPIGSWGRLVTLIDNPKTLRSVIEHRQFYQSQALKTHILQRYVKAGCSDLRILVLGGEVLGAIRRTATNGDWRSNVARGGVVERAELCEELEELAIRVASAIGGEFLGVDVFEEDGRYLVNEVNGVPEFKGFMEATGINVPRILARYLKEALRR